MRLPPGRPRVLEGGRQGLERQRQGRRLTGWPLSRWPRPRARGRAVSLLLVSSPRTPPPQGTATSQPRTPRPGTTRRPAQSQAERPSPRRASALTACRGPRSPAVLTLASSAPAAHEADGARRCSLCVSEQTATPAPAGHGGAPLTNPGTTPGPGTTDPRGPDCQGVLPNSPRRGTVGHVTLTLMGTGSGLPHPRLRVGEPPGQGWTGPAWAVLCSSPPEGQQVPRCRRAAVRTWACLPHGAGGRPCRSGASRGGGTTAGSGRRGHRPGPRAETQIEVDRWGWPGPVGCWRRSSGGGPPRRPRRGLHASLPSRPAPRGDSGSPRLRTLHAELPLPDSSVSFLCRGRLSGQEMDFLALPLPGSPSRGSSSCSKQNSLRPPLRLFPDFPAPQR